MRCPDCGEFTSTPLAHRQLCLAMSPEAADAEQRARVEREAQYQAYRMRREFDAAIYDDRPHEEDE
jgi:hypothetical protein